MILVEPRSPTPGHGAVRDHDDQRGFALAVVVFLLFAVGMAAATEVAARRYIDAADFGPDVTGEFFASAPKKMTGPLHKMEYPHISDPEVQEATWRATVVVAGGIDVPSGVRPSHGGVG